MNIFLRNRKVSLPIISLITSYFKIFRGPLAGVGIAIAAIGGYLYGVSDANHKIQAYEQQLRKEISDLQSKNNQTNTQIVTQYVDRIKTITQKEYVYVKQANDIVPSQYFLSNGWVYEHDSAASLAEADSAKAADGTASTIKDNIALATVVDNYAVCYKNAEQLKSLQDWIKQYNANVDAVNAGK